MVLTRVDCVLAYHHFLDNVLDRNDTSQLKQALLEHGVDDINSLLLLSDPDIENLEFTDTTNRIVKVRLADKRLLGILYTYILHRASSPTPINDDWLLLTKLEFDTFRVDPINRPSNRNTTYPAPTVAPVIRMASTASPPADIFRKGIKRDATLFPILQDEALNDIWHRAFLNQARAQDVQQVLDHTYIPILAEDIDLFQEKQKYMYAVLSTKVKTDRGQAIVRKYDITFDAQNIYEELTEHHLRSTKASIDASTILTYITSAKLGTGAWNGNTETFIIHWDAQVRLYERQVKNATPFTDVIKKAMLENAVNLISELRQVRIIAHHETARTGVDLSYDAYLHLLLSAATAYDNSLTLKQPFRQALTHQQSDTEIDDDYDIDIPISTIMANATQRRHLKSFPKSNKLPANPA
jgi:hypothetical protein